MVNYPVKRKILFVLFICQFGVILSTYSYAGSATDLAFIRDVNPIIQEKTTEVARFNLQEPSELKFVATGMIRFYQKYISSQDGPACNFSPSCSRFGMACIQEYGVLRGILLAADRLIRCNGFKSNHYFKDLITGKYTDPILDYAF